MKTTDNTPAIIPGLGWFFQWIDRNPRAADVLIWISAAALMYAVFTYNFTIPAYK